MEKVGWAFWPILFAYGLHVEWWTLRGQNKAQNDALKAENEAIRAERDAVKAASNAPELNSELWRAQALSSGDVSRKVAPALTAAVDALAPPRGAE